MHPVRCTQSLLLCTTIAKLSLLLSRFLRRGLPPRFRSLVLRQKPQVRSVADWSRQSCHRKGPEPRAPAPSTDVPSVDTRGRPGPGDACPHRLGPYFLSRRKSQWCRHDNAQPGARVPSWYCQRGRPWARRPFARVGRGRSFGRNRRRDDHPGLLASRSRRWPVPPRCGHPFVLPCGARHVACRADQGAPGHPNDQATDRSGGASRGQSATPRARPGSVEEDARRRGFDQSALGRRDATRPKTARFRRRCGRGVNQTSDTPHRRGREVLHFAQPVTSPKVEATPPSETTGRQSARACSTRTRSAGP